MSGFGTIKKGKITITDYSTSSTVKIELRKLEEVEQGKLEEVTETLWLDYGEFSDLKDAIEEIKNR